MSDKKHKPIVYSLINKSLNKRFGKVSFNGKFVFMLDSSIDSDTWNRVGIIPLNKGDRSATITGDQFYYLSSRLPQNLRNSPIEEKLKYVDETGLAVASDSFILEKEA